MTDTVRPRRSDATRAAILDAARERFAADGYERATIRAIAADARIDPAMVMRYYGNKEKLFAAAAQIDLRLPDLTAVPRDQVGTRLARHFLERWEDDETMAALLRAAATNEGASHRMREMFATQLVPVVAVASRIVFHDRFQLVMSSEADRVAKTSHLPIAGWVRRLAEGGLCSLECLQALAEGAPRFVPVQADEVRLPEAPARPSEEGDGVRPAPERASESAPSAR